jgi:hypothetical protein
MGLLDDYQDEMDRLSPNQIDAILSSERVSDPAAERAIALVGDIRDALIEEPPAEVAARHLGAMASAVPGESRAATALPRRKTPMRILSRRRIAAMSVAATLVLAAGIAAAVTLPPQANDTAKTKVPSDPDVVTGQPEGVPPAEAEQGQPEGVPPAEAEQGQPEGVPPAEAEHGQTVSGIAQGVEGCDDALDLAEIASDGRLDRAELPVEPCGQGDEAALGGGASGSANGGGSGGPGGASGGGGGGGSSITGAGGSGSGGPGGGGGGGSGPGGGGGGSGGPGGGSGGGGPTSSSSEAPIDVPTPSDLPTP